MSKVTHIKLTYFKTSGKYYSEGELDLPYAGGATESRPLMFHEALERVVLELNAGRRPGLVDGMDFDVLVEVFTELGPFYHLFVRDEDGYVGRRSMRMNEQLEERRLHPDDVVMS